MRLILASLLGAFAPVAIASGDVSHSPPKWGFLGDDESLRETFHDTEEVLLVCICATKLEEVRPPHAKVVHSATVTRSMKGAFEIGDNIVIEFMTDSLPIDDDERGDFAERENSSLLGDLRFAFGEFSNKNRITAELLYMPKFSPDLDVFVRGLAGKSTKERAVAPNP